jgi:hypothetical protein
LVYIYHGHLVFFAILLYFMAIWYFYGHCGILFPVWFCCSKKTFYSLKFPTPQCLSFDLQLIRINCTYLHTLDIYNDLSLVIEGTPRNYVLQSTVAVYLLKIRKIRRIFIYVSWAIWHCCVLLTNLCFKQQSWKRHERMTVVFIQCSKAF